MNKIEDIIFYTIEKCIKSYRKFAQNQLNESGHIITIDQWLVLSILNENKGISQNEIAAKVFKDTASVTRIIELIVKAGYVRRSVNQKDRRRTELSLTKKGELELRSVKKIVLMNRKSALKGISKSELILLSTLLNKITTNCHDKKTK